MSTVPPSDAPPSDAPPSDPSLADTSVRRIIHVDMDAFYASVEQRDNPALRGRPVAVGGPPESRGVVAAASYEARAYGVRSATSSAQAKRLCPQLVFVPPRFEVYRGVSKRIHSIFREYTPLIEPLSLDEAFLDVTHNLVGSPYATPIAREIRRRIRAELQLTASAGVGPNKFIAKLASDANKPDGITVVPPGRIQEFLDPLPVERLWGVGPATAARLRSHGFERVEDVARTSRAELERILGNGGSFLHALAHGQDDRPVSPGRPARSRGAERTFARDLTDIRAMRAFLGTLAEEVAQSLQRIGRPGRTVTVKVRFDDFTTVSRSLSLAGYTYDAETLSQTALSLLDQTEAERRPVRLLGVSVSGLYGAEEDRQLWLPFREERLRPYSRIKARSERV